MTCLSRHNGLYNRLFLNYFLTHDYGSLQEIENWCRDDPYKVDSCGMTRQRKNIPNRRTIFRAAKRNGYRVVRVRPNGFYKGAICCDGLTVVFHPATEDDFVETIIAKDDIQTKNRKLPTGVTH